MLLIYIYIYIRIVRIIPKILVFLLIISMLINENRLMIIMFMHIFIVSSYTKVKSN